MRQWSIKQCTSPMMIHNITPSVDYNNWLKCLDTQLNEPTKQINNGPQVVEPTFEKTLLLNFGD